MGYLKGYLQEMVIHFKMSSLLGVKICQIYSQYVALRNNNLLQLPLPLLSLR